jgi:hypothetical protein
MTASSLARRWGTGWASLPPPSDEPILHAKFHGGPADGQQKLIGNSTHEWDRQGVVVLADDGTFAYYDHSHI